MGVACDGTHCAAGQFCDHEFHLCGLPNGNCEPDNGDCRDALTGCGPTSPAACGCDGEVYENECVANAAGMDVSASACDDLDVPLGRFPCGTLFCDAATSYCLIAVGDNCEYEYACELVGTECGAPPIPDCDCIDLRSCNIDCTCSTVPGNGVTGVVVHEFQV